ncbi:hypothetical protein IJ00_19010 [Calothrix sp. 336/3]|nr:S-layer family protein [Calothrix sp. 336/3]AKG23080.1 hypothetical protein IJ00_19010 [Calothrix sp. 336/3]
MEFAAKPQTSTPLLTVSIPIGLKFRGEQSATVVNAGNLNVNPGKNLSLIGSTTINAGKIFAPGGEITLASMPGEGIVKIRNGSITNFELKPQGKIGSNVILPSVNLPGWTVTNGVLKFAGIPIAKQAGTTINTGKIDVTSAQIGGKVKILGSQVGLYPGSLIDASGNLGGGKVFLGGNYQGKGELFNANATFIHPSATILANAIKQGNGGEIIVWSNQATRTYGNFQARGGKLFGNGGLIETSSNQFLDVANIKVDASAKNGLPGTWLLDPRNVILTYAPTTNGTFDSNNIFTPNGNDAVVNISDIETQLSNGNNVTITTGNSGNQEGNITTVNNGFGINPTNNTPVTLTLRAANNIVISSENGGFGINAGNAPLNIILEADIDKSGKGNIIIGGKNGWGIDTKGGQFLATTPGLFSVFNGAIYSNNDKNFAAAPITINANTITLEKAGIITNTTGLGKGADINVVTKNIQLLGNAGIDSSTKGVGNGGNTTITTDNLLIQNNGGIGNYDNTGNGKPGTVKVTANNEIKLINIAGIRSTSKGNVGSGDVIVTAPNIIVSNFARISSNPENNGNGGNVTVTADNLLIENNSFIGNDNFTGNDFFSETQTSLNNNIFNGTLGTVNVTAKNSITLRNNAGISSNVGAPKDFVGVINGNAGVVNVKTRSLRIENQSGLTTNIGLSVYGTQPVGLENKGNAGVINIEADSIFITGRSGTGSLTLGSGNSGKTIIRVGTLTLRDGSGIIVSTGINPINGEATNNSGKGGRVEIIAKVIDLDEESRITSQTGGKGDAGEILITTDALILNNGSNLTTSTLANILGNAGRAGKIKINANSINLGKNAAIISEALSNGVGGNIELDVKGDVILGDRSRISVSSSGKTQLSKAGDIFINAGALRLDNNSRVISQSASGDGGNIQIKLQDLLTLRRQSQISTTAGTDLTGGNGGNITINAPIILAFPQENSDITANAFEGAGGNVNITSQSILGIKFRPNLTEFSDITASSKFGLSGVVTINTPDVDPSRGLTELPEEVIDKSQEITQHVCTKIIRGEFLITGRGGIPMNPNETLRTDNVYVDLAEPAPSKTYSQNPAKPNAVTSKEVTPARGWVYNDKGELVLTAYDPTDPSSQRPGNDKVLCSS